MSRPKITPNQISAAGTTAGQVLTSDGTNASWQSAAAKLDALPNGTSVSVARTFSSAGDTNGVFYFLGTQLGASTWGNPQTTAQIVAVRSTNGAGTVADIFDRTTNATYTDGGALGDFIFVDLGANRSLVPNYYSLRNYNQANRELRTWKLQGTNSVAGTSVAQINAATWTDLDVRTNDTTMAGASAWANFTPNQANTTAFRYLRILQTGNDALGQPYICVAEWEMYGTFNYTSSALVDGRLIQVDGTGGLDVRQTAFSAVGGRLSTVGDMTLSSDAANGSITITPTGTGSITLNGPITANSLSADIQTFDSSGTWTKPTGAKVVEVICIGAGGGGGSGARNTSSAGGGGSGGAGGAIARGIFNAASISNTSVTVGAGGAGGAAVSATSTAGNNGTAGGNTTFGNWLRAGGGGRGLGGTVAGTSVNSDAGGASNDATYSLTSVSGQNAVGFAGALGSFGGGPRNSEFGGATGGVGGVSGGFGGCSILGGPGGGGGGGFQSGVGNGGGQGGRTGSYNSNGGGGGSSGNTFVGSQDGVAGSAPAYGLCGDGGGGGGAPSSTAAGNGGAGNIGAGGGGGAAGLNTSHNSGAGGNGGNGRVIVITYR